MAEFIMKALAERAGCGDKFVIMSAATSREEIGNDMYPAAKKRLREEGISFTPRKAVPMQRSDYDEFDLLIGMDGENIRNMRRIAGGDPEDKIWKMMDFTDEAGEDVSDPWYTGNFIGAYDDIHKGCAALLAKFRAEGRI